MKVIALVGFEARGKSAAASMSSRAATYTVESHFNRDNFDEVPKSVSETFVIQPVRHDLEVLPVIINVDVPPLRNRVDQRVIERPIHAAEDDSAIRDGRQSFELVERRDVRKWTRELERAQPLGRRSAVADV